MERTRLGYFYLGGLVCVQYKRREAIFLDSPSKYLLAVRTLYPRFVGFLLSLQSQDFRNGSVSQHQWDTNPYQRGTHLKEAESYPTSTQFKFYEDIIETYTIQDLRLLVQLYFKNSSESLTKSL
jgi:hypothetical protein